VSGTIGPAPSGKDLYTCAVIASMYAFFGGMVLLALAQFLPGGEGAIAFFTMLGATFVFFAPFAIATIFLIAPLGCLIAVGLQAWLPPTQWHGAVTGAITAITLLSPLSFFGIEALVISNPKALALIASLIAVAALAGWHAQRTVLQWPSKA